MNNTNALRADPGIHRVTTECDVCVVGGGITGLCAAIAAARRGAKTVLIHDRPVLGGNASSEVRMWICGAHGPHNKETGLLEEIQLENAYRNPSLNYSLWDSVLYGAVAKQPNLTPMLNASVCNAQMDGGRLVSVLAWQLTSQTWHTVHAKQFIDCSGDSILAPLTGAETRWGRESREEFDEDIEPMQADGKTMGNTCLIQMRRTDSPQPFTPPSWAVRFENPEDLPHRLKGVRASNFWWLEIGGLLDTIGDAEMIRDQLYAVALGVWDFMKNRAEGREEAENWAIEYLGSLPGKRENRRYVGDHIMTQHDVRRGEGSFDDVVAHGGWSMDDHHPAGIFYPGKPTLFHPAPSPYDIPYRCLYSRDVPNLFCAGRNISVTHATLSSTRVMGTCATLGQAVGTAAAICIKQGSDPRSLSSGESLKKLQTALMLDDQWLPGRPRKIDPLALSAQLQAEGDNAPHLIDGIDRDRPDASHAWQGEPGTPIEFTWNQPVRVGGVRMVFDSNLLNEKRMPDSYPKRGDRSLVPGVMVKSFKVETRDRDGNWSTVHRDDNNYQRLVNVELQQHTDALRVTPLETWGADVARMFSCEPVTQVTPGRPQPMFGPTFKQMQNALDPGDLQPPDSGLEATASQSGHSA
jgi:hypothetical protein